MANDSTQILDDAHKQSQRLLAELELQAVEFEASSPSLPAEVLAEGRDAMKQSISAARRVAGALDEAVRRNETSSDQGNP